MAKHSSPTTGNWRQIIVWAIVGLVVVAGAASVYLLLRDDDPGAQTASREPAAATTGTTPTDCTPATVWAAPGLAPAVQEVADRTSDDCFSYLVVTRTAALAQSGLRGGETPDVWLPDSDAWPVLVEQGGVELAVGETVASSPVLLAGTPQVVQALGDLGIGPDTSFAELVRTYQRLAATGGERPVTMRVGDPRTDPATMALLSTVGSQLDAGEAGSPGRQSLVVLAQTAAPGDPLTAIAADPRTVVPATEQQIAAGAQAGTELVGIALEGGAGVVRMPFVRVGDAGSAEAVDALERALISPDAEADLADLGLRPGTDGPAPGVAGVPDDVTTKGEATSPEQVLATAQIWTVIAPQSRILTLIDISGSMAAEVGDTTRIGLTRQAAQAALGVIPQQTAIGLWYFATALDGDKDYVQEVPLRALDEEVRSGVTQKDVLLAQTDALGVDTLTGDTGLHDALWAAYQHMQEQYSPDSISSVLLLTDGRNDDPTGGLAEDEVVALLTRARESGERPVTVVLIGMGPDVDEEALDVLATAAGGESLVLRDPAELPQVFVDVVARRAPGR